MMRQAGKKTVRVGMVGYRFMGKVHSNAYRGVPFFFDTEVVPILQGIAGRDEDAVKREAQILGFATYETDWRRLIERDDIDVIDIVTPNHMHADIAIAAAEAGKHVISEKPLAMTTEQGRQMLDAVQKAGVVHMVCHNYRFAPAVQFAKKLIEEGRIGQIRHIRAQYIQDWLMDPNTPLTWRLQKDVTGTGTLGDIGSHIIDLARFLVGEFSEVVGMWDTIVKQRPLGENSTEMGEVTVDDACSFLARFHNGAMGVFEATRFAGGNRAGNRFEINGEKGSIRWDLENMNSLQVYFQDDEPALQGFRTIHCTGEHHPYTSAYWPTGHSIGYEHTFINLMVNFMQGISTGVSPSPSFEDGLRNQYVLEAVEQSILSRQWASVQSM
ncbi:Gfo/Idh/MocA family protein [Brevibacillus centrosporus]|uniref:Gfo/Idh/MocA family protein n=1 Tax=Brevibacillus centrosporus TaxID=54910 RepID=UPI003986E7D8